MTIYELDILVSIKRENLLVKNIISRAFEKILRPMSKATTYI